MTRVSHWGITASFVLLFGTGAAIYDHRPRFHIGTSVLALPRIPLWLAITASPRLIHYIFAAVFVLFGAAYYAWGWYKGHFKHFVLDRNDIANATSAHGEPAAANASRLFLRNQSRIFEHPQVLHHRGKRNSVRPR